MVSSGQNRRGILNPHAGEKHFTLSRHAPAPDLAPYVERYWIVHWDLRDRAPYAQETLPYPCVNLVVGAHRPGVHGAGTKRFVAELSGEGWVVGAKFRPGGFKPFFSGEMVDLTDRTLSLGDAFGESGRAFEEAALASVDDVARLARVEEFLRRRAPAPDELAAKASSVVDLVQSKPSITRVVDLAERVDLSVRALQRLFATYVGVSPKWVIRRFRVHEAAEGIAGRASIDWTDLAHECGYFDQAHFIRDFKAQIGKTPTEYAALCAGR